MRKNQPRFRRDNAPAFPTKNDNKRPLDERTVVLASAKVVIDYLMSPQRTVLFPS